jgi:hypothetical protein
MMRGIVFVIAGSIAHHARELMSGNGFAPFVSSAPVIPLVSVSVFPPPISPLVEVGLLPSSWSCGGGWVQMAVLAVVLPVGVEEHA